LCHRQAASQGQPAAPPAGSSSLQATSQGQQHAHCWPRPPALRAPGCW
jgi:hypothetical protein